MKIRMNSEFVSMFLFLELCLYLDGNTCRAIATYSMQLSAARKTHRGTHPLRPLVCVVTARMGGKNRAAKL